MELSGSCYLMQYYVGLVDPKAYSMIHRALKCFSTMDMVNRSEVNPVCCISGGITENFGEGYEFKDRASRVGSATLEGQSIGLYRK